MTFLTHVVAHPDPLRHAIQERVFVFGGAKYKRFFNDVHALDVPTMEWSLLEVQTIPTHWPACPDTTRRLPPTHPHVHTHHTPNIPHGRARTHHSHTPHPPSHTQLSQLQTHLLPIIRFYEPAYVDLF